LFSLYLFNLKPATHLRKSVNALVVSLESWA